MAFTHRSASVILPNGSSVNNERLEFLGDAILDAVVADYLFTYYPNKDEGFLSKMRSKIVKRQQLNVMASALGLDSLIIKGCINSNGGKYIVGNTLEALIGAIYLDKGYEKTKKVVINRIIKQLISFDELEKREFDFKSRIIEWAQKSRSEIIFESQEDYPGKSNTPIFISRIVVDSQILGEGRGTSKKEAEQNAAEQALTYIDVK